MSSAFGIVVFLLFAVIGIGSVVLWIVALIDALNTPDATWTAVGENKVLWVVLIAVLGVLGAVLYWFMPRPKLKGTTGF